MGEVEASCACGDAASAADGCGCATGATNVEASCACGDAANVAAADACGCATGAMNAADACAGNAVSTADGSNAAAAPAASASEERRVRVIEVKQSVFASNERAADALREELKARGTFLLNLMSSPGSGKTTTLRRTVAALSEKLAIGVMEADIDSDVDARTMAEAGVVAIQLHTGGMCHLDAAMCRQGLAELDAAATEAGAAPLDLAILENVGNLVCPAEFDTGASVNVAILSVPEGDDKPLKYPLMFEVTDVVLVNKMDVAPYFDFSLERCIENVHLRNPGAVVIPISAKTGEGVGEWTSWLEQAVAGWKAGTFSKATPANCDAPHYPGE